MEMYNINQFDEGEMNSCRVINISLMSLQSDIAVIPYHGVDYFCSYRGYGVCGVAQLL